MWKVHEGRRGGAKAGFVHAYKLRVPQATAVPLLSVPDHIVPATEHFGRSANRSEDDNSAALVKPPIKSWREKNLTMYMDGSNAAALTINRVQ